MTHVDSYLDRPRTALDAMKPWYEAPEAQKALAAIAYGHFTTERHVKQFPLTRDEWTTREGRAADILRKIWFETAEMVLANYITREQNVALWNAYGLDIDNQKASDAVIGGYSPLWLVGEEIPASLLRFRNIRNRRAAA